MEQRVSLITLGVADLARARAFYEEGLGWSPSPASQESVTFYQAGGLAVGLYPRPALADDCGLEDPGPQVFCGLTLAYNTRSREEADAVLAQAVAAGGRLVKPAEEVFWGGYSGYFADPDGHLWEVAHNPFWELSPDGALQLPDA
ncbi:MAG TPA: VOC family protein [Kiloniellaceae bacterium]|nr:VOC family protein [Kiloniellaceae bacterium]